MIKQQKMSTKNKILIFTSIITVISYAISISFSDMVSVIFFTIAVITLVNSLVMSSMLLIASIFKGKNKSIILYATLFCINLILPLYVIFGYFSMFGNG